MSGLDRYLPRNDWAGPRQESWIDYLPYHVAQPVRENPLFQAVQGYLNRPSAEIKMPARDDEVPMPRKPGMLDNASPFTLDAVDKAGLLATFLGPGAKTANLGALARARQMAEASVRSRTAPNADVKPGTLPDFKDQVVAAWNKGDSLKKIAYDFGVDVRDVAPLVQEARAAGNASPYRSPSARMGLTDEKIIEGLKEGRLLKDMAAEYGLREQGLHNRIRKMRLAGVFDGENAVPAPVKGTRPNAYDEPTMARLVERYKNGESFEALAADLGVSRTHITDILEPHLSGFRNVSPKASDDLLKFIKSQREQGRTFAEIAKEMGRSPAAVGGLATRARQQGWEIPAVAGMGALSYGAIEAALAPDQQ